VNSNALYVFFFDESIQVGVRGECETIAF